MFKQIKQNKGITMMVLVVTIIVMLILAGVSVAVFNPNTGLITKSKKIVNGYEASQEIQATETDAVIESLKDRNKRPINITWTKSNSDWTNENVVVTAKANLSGYTLEISKDGRNWSKNTTTEVSQYGEEVFARLMNNSNNEDVQYSNIQITNIDKKAPTNDAPTAKVVTTNKIEVENNQVESGSGKNEEYSASGIKEVKYRLLSSRDAVEALEGYDWQDEGVFEKLTHNTTYYVQTYMKDNAGNETYSLVQEIKTVSVPSAKDFITQTPNTDKFTNKDKQILVSSINKEFNFEVSTDNKIWTTAVDGTITKITTQNGDKVYAKLTDGYNYGEPVVYTESLIDKDLPTTAAPTLKATTNTIKATNNQKDATSKITTQYQIKKATETTWKDLQDSDTFSNLEQTTKYDVRTHSIDEAGNESYSSSATIETLTVPSGTTTGIITLTANKTTWTNTDVIVTAKTSTSGFTMQMSTDGGTTFKDATSVTMTANGTVVARLRDASNNYGGIASKAITIIDKVAPSAPTITNSSNENWSNKDVTITLKATDNLSGINRYEWNEGSGWTSYSLTTTDGVGTLRLYQSRNSTIKIRAIDNANNISEETSTIVKMDKNVPPTTAPTLASSTTNSVTIKNNQIDPLSGNKTVQYQIKKNADSTWGNLQTSATFGNLVQNTKYDVRTYVTDNAGNSSYSNILTVKTLTVPSAITLQPSWGGYSAGTMKINATTTSTGYTIQMSLNSTNNFTDTSAVTASDNGTVYARLRDSSGNYGASASISINSIINNTNAKNHYGEKVNYHPSTDPNGVYRMFYYDEKGEFGKSKTVYLYRDYTDDAIMEIDESTSQTGFARFKELNPSYKDLIGNSIVTNTPTNAKYGTYLCDQNNFTRYLDSTKAYSVVGGPSIEMFIKSYNQVSHTINLHTITNVIAKTMDDGYKGYVFSIDGKEKYYDHNILDYSSQNGMYVNSQNRWTYLTSPSAYDDGYLFMNTGKNFSGFEVEDGEDYDGSVVGIHYRPLIALNESTVFNFE